MLDKYGKLLRNGVIYMSKGKPNKRYTAEFKQTVVETMRKEGLSYKETERQFGLSRNRAASWERIYLEEGPEGLQIERRGRSGKGGRPPNQLKPEVEKDLIAEVQRLRAEVAYLKKLNALVLEEERQSIRRK